MFSPGRIAFAVAFGILMVISYRKDAKNHEAYYKNAAKKVALYGTIVIVLFLGFKYLTSVLF